MKSYMWLYLIIPSIILLLITVIGYYYETRNKIRKVVPAWIWVTFSLSMILFYTGLVGYGITEYKSIPDHHILVHDPNWQSKIVSVPE